MNKAIVLGLILSFNSLAQNNKEEELLPEFFLLGNKKSNSVLTMKCKGEKPYDEIDCFFSQVRVDKKSDDDIKNLIDEMKGDLKKKNLVEIKDIFHCSAIEELSNKDLDESFSKSKRDYLKLKLENIKDICVCTNKKSKLDDVKKCINQNYETLFLTPNWNRHEE